MRAPKVCAEPGCVRFVADASRCEAHQLQAPSGWRARPSSTRAVRASQALSARERRAIIRRDRGLCCECGGPGASEVDHRIPLFLGGTNDPKNLAAIHADPCHKRKTARESGLARRSDRS